MPNNLLFLNNFLKFSLFFKKKNFFILDIFFKKYFLYKQQKNIFFEIININVLFSKNSISQWFLKALKKSSLKIKNRYFFYDDFFKLIATSLISKDCLLFLNWLKVFLEKINIKFHKHFLVFFFFLISNLNIFLLKYFNCLGIKFLINGKFGIGGSIKTKTISFRKGLNSLNSKTLKLEFQKTQIKTKSGTLGVKFYLFY